MRTTRTTTSSPRRRRSPATTTMTTTPRTMMTTDGGREGTGPAAPAGAAPDTVPLPSWRGSVPAADDGGRAGPGDAGPEPGADPMHSRRRWVPARAQIMGWVLLVMAAALVLVNVAVWQALRTAVDDRIDRALTQEIGEFEEFAATGTHPATQRRFADMQSLFRVHITQQHPDRNEIIFGYVEDTPQATVPTGRIRQGQKPPFDASADGPARRAVLDSPNARGSVDTPAGLLRWEKLRVAPPGGA